MRRDFNQRYHCIKCGHDKPAGYLMCRKCTFGADSLAGRLQDAYDRDPGAAAIAELRSIGFFKDGQPNDTSP